MPEAVLAEPVAVLRRPEAVLCWPEAVLFVHGRGQAIAQLVAAASADDVLVLAGKGHEDYQEIHGERQPFSDLIEAGKALAVWEVAHA